MSWKRLSDRELDALLSLGAAVPLYLYLVKHDLPKGKIFPGQTGMCKALGVNRRTISRHLAILEKSGLIQVRFRGKRETSEYLLVMRGDGTKMSLHSQGDGTNLSEVMGQKCPIEVEEEKKSTKGSPSSSSDVLPFAAPPTEPQDSHSSYLDFERWWEVWPSNADFPAYTRKVGRNKVWEKWDRLVANGGLPPIARMLQVLEWQKTTEDWTHDSGQFIPGPMPYLNGERWDVEVPDEVMSPTQEQDTMLDL